MPGYTGYVDFMEDAMLDMIDLYKASSANIGPSKAWAVAGRDGWSFGGAPPKGDRQAAHRSAACRTRAQNSTSTGTRTSFTRAVG
jgi:hypothetical protein